MHLFKSGILLGNTQLYMYEYQNRSMEKSSIFFHLKLFLLDILWNIDSFNSATEKKEMTGLAIGVSSMKAGEHALLHVGWELGYGKEGSFSFPNVPPMADLVYEVVLIGFDETKEVSCSEWLFFPEIDGVIYVGC